MVVKTLLYKSCIYKILRQCFILGLLITKGKFFFDDFKGGRLKTSTESNGLGVGYWAMIIATAEPKTITAKPTSLAPKPFTIRIIGLFSIISSLSFWKFSRSFV